MTKHKFLQGQPFRFPNIGNVYKYDSKLNEIVYITGFDRSMFNPSQSYIGAYCFSVIYKNRITGDDHCKTIYYSDLIEAKTLPCT